MTNSRKSAREVIDFLNVKNQGLNDGHSNVPESSSEILNDVQQEIVSHYNRESGALEVETSEKISAIRSRLGEKDFKATFDQARGFTSDVFSEIRKVFDSNKDTLLDLSRKRSQAELDLKYFVEVNDLKRHASYPDSLILHWSIVFLMVVLESVANSYFFAQGSDLGLIGGFFQAVFVSVANIGVALFVGYFWRNKNKEAEKIKAYFAMGIYIIFLLGFNLGVAHYRAALEISPDSAIEQAIINLFTLETTFRVNNFDAWILFTVGVLFSLFAMIKSYRSDDIFPDYGDITRKHRKGIEEFNKYVQEVRNTVYSTLNERKSALESNVNLCRAIDKDYPRLIKDIKDSVVQSKKNLQHNKDDCVLVIKTYRDSNTSVRNTPTPAYWDNDEELVIDIEFDRFNPTENEIAFGGEISDKLEAIESSYYSTIENYANTTNEAFDQFEELIVDIQAAGKAKNMVHR